MVCHSANAQGTFAGYENLFSVPKGYMVRYASKLPQVDGDITDDVWQTALRTDSFIDIEGENKPRPKFKTRAKMIWGDSCLYIAAELEEPHVWASLDQPDAIIYHDNDFEVFIDPNNDTHQYFEVEVNAYNTILDLFMSKPYRNVGAAMLSYNTAGFRSGVKVMGTINSPAGKGNCWTVEMAIPFRAIYIGNQWRSPQEGALLRINFSRVQWEINVITDAYSRKKDKNGKPLPENNWVWSPQGVVNMHYPERWGYLQFTKDTLNQPGFVLPLDEKRKQYLWLLYYKQKSFFNRNGKYAASIQDLDLPSDHVQVKGTVPFR
jgi:hypothetical protein